MEKRDRECKEGVRGTIERGSVSCVSLENSNYRPTVKVGFAFFSFPLRFSHLFCLLASMLPCFLSAVRGRLSSSRRGSLTTNQLVANR